MAAGPAPLPLEVAEQVCRRLFLQANTGELIEAPGFIEEFSATVRNMLAHKSVFENYLGGQFIVQANRCFSARDRTRCIAELLEDGVERAVLKLPESSLVAINQVLDYCSLVHSKTLPEANLATKAKQLAANSTQVQLYELATVLVQASTQEISKRMTDAFKNPAFLSKALKNSGLSATTDTRRDMSARSLRKKSEIATKLNPNTVTENASDTKQTPQTKLSVEEAKEKSVSEGEKLRRKRRKEKQKERKRQLKLQAEAEAAAAASAPCSSAPGTSSSSSPSLSCQSVFSDVFVIRSSDGSISVGTEDDLADLGDNGDDSDFGSDHDDEVDEEIEEFRRRLESLGGPISPQPMRARVTLSPTLLGLNS